MKMRSAFWLVLLLQLAVSFAAAVAIGFLDDEAHSLGVLMQSENVPMLMAITLLFFTVLAAVSLAVFDRHAAEVRAKEDERRSAR